MRMDKCQEKVDKHVKGDMEGGREGGREGRREGGRLTAKEALAVKSRPRSSRRKRGRARPREWRVHRFCMSDWR
jgi:Ni/Co efflux regulator RcnB